jgi:hypothetical protein
MLSTIRRHVNATTIVAIAALVFAMTGGALAVTGHRAGDGSGVQATRSAGGGQGARIATAVAAKSKAKPKVKAGPRGPAGPAGKNGANGAPGATGPAGPTGPTGASGPQGVAGNAGKNGTDGQSVASKTVAAKEAACGGAGGSEFTSASGTTLACNGSPWTAGGTLPSGATETGVVSIAVIPTPQGIVRTSISFTVPLKAGVTAQLIGPEEGEGEANEKVPAGCKGNATEPKAEAGNLCVFMSSELNVSAGGILTPEAGEPELTGKTGGVLELFATDPTAGLSATGTWAVTEAKG